MVLGKECCHEEADNSQEPCGSTAASIAFRTVDRLVFRALGAFHRVGFGAIWYVAIGAVDPGLVPTVMP